MMTIFLKKESIFPILILFGNFLSTLATFMMLPILALHSMKEFRLTASEVGLLCAIWPTVLCSTTIFFGAIADKFGHGKILKIGLLFQVSSFILMAYSVSITEFAIAQVLFGLGKSFFDSAIKAIFVLSSPQDRLPFFFRIRYMLVNVACIIGPVFGVLLYDVIRKQTFLISGLIYALFLILFLFLEPASIQFHRAVALVAKSSFKYQISKMLQDKFLLVWIISSFVILFVFGAYESMMPLVLSNEARVLTFGYLLSLNGCTVVLIQLLLFICKDLRSEYQLTVFGFIGFVSGFLVFSLPIESEYKFFVGTFLFSCGEAFLFPQMEIKLNSMSPENNKATYFGIAEIKQSGFFIGPIFGGLIYEHFGRKMLFMSCSIMLIFSAIIYIRILMSRTEEIF
jgi:MFS family permease